MSTSLEEDANDYESGCLVCSSHKALVDQMECSMNRSYDEDPDVNESIDKFLNLLENILFFPINFGVNYMEVNGCCQQESAFSDDDEQATLSPAPLFTHDANNNTVGAVEVKHHGDVAAVDNVDGSFDAY